MTRRKRPRTKSQTPAPEKPPLRSRITLLAVILVAIPIVTTLYEVHRVKPFVDDVVMSEYDGNDWFMYKKIALEIIHDGIEIPSRDNAYARPASFLYGYFVAAVFVVLGENATMVYVVQGALLGVALVILFLAFKSRFPRWMFIPILGLQLLLMYFEIGPWFVGHILSENLLCILVPWALFFLVRAYRSESARDLVIAGVFTGLCHLTRPNAILMIPFAAVVLGVYLKASERKWRRGVALFLLGVVLSQLPLIVRNVYVTHKVTAVTFSPLFFKPKKRGTDWAYFMAATGLTRISKRKEAKREAEGTPTGVTFFVDRGLFISGIRTVDGVVVHWVLMWIGAAALIGLSIRRRRLAFEDALLLAMVIALLGPLVFGGSLNSYGARWFIAATPLLLLLTCRAMVLAIPSAREAVESG